jgi:hypothetical protein
MAITTSAQSATWGIAERSWNQPSANASAEGVVTVGVALGPPPAVVAVGAVGLVEVDDVDRADVDGEDTMGLVVSTGALVADGGGPTGADWSATSSLRTMIRCRADYFGWHDVNVSWAVLGSVVATTWMSPGSTISVPVTA